MLVLDDDWNLLSLLRGYFQGLRWRVEACDNVAHGRERLVAEPWDLVISDLHFTAARAAEGLELVAEARRLHPEAALLLLTGADAEAVRSEAVRRGADLVMAKPVRLADLQEAALRAMKRR